MCPAWIMCVVQCTSRWGGGGGRQNMMRIVLGVCRGKQLPCSKFVCSVMIQLRSTQCTCLLQMGTNGIKGEEGRAPQAAAREPLARVCAGVRLGLRHQPVEGMQPHRSRPR